MIKWEEIKLGEILNLITKGTTPPKGVGFVDKGINYVKSDAIGYDRKLDKTKIVQINAETHQKFKRSQLAENDILFSMAGIYLGKNALVSKDILPANTNQALAILRLNQEKANPNYVSLYLSQQSMIDFVNNMSGQSAQPNVNFEEIKSIEIKLPPLPEQTAIANALSDMDALIAQTEKLIEKKKAIKQGVMQELLKPKDGWAIKRLGDLVDKVSTGKLDANAMKPDGEYRFYTCAKEYFYIDRYAFDDEALLISGNGANVGYIHYYNGKFNAYQRTYVLIGFQIDVFFLKIYLDRYLADRITTEVSAGNTPYIKMDTITEMVVQYPLALKEQSAISSQLNDIEKEIQIIETKLQKLKHQKQGMMQALLTGKIRLI